MIITVLWSATAWRSQTTGSSSRCCGGAGVGVPCCWQVPSGDSDAWASPGETGCASMAAAVQTCSGQTFAAYYVRAGLKGVRCMPCFAASRSRNTACMWRCSRRVLTVLCWMGSDETWRNAETYILFILGFIYFYNCFLIIFAVAHCGSILCGAPLSTVHCVQLL